MSDDETDRRLTPLIGLVAVVAGGVLAFALTRLTTAPPASAHELATIATITFLITVTAIVKVPVRIRSATHALTWIEAGVVVALAVAPTEQVVLATGLGVTIATAILRISPVKVVFSVSKNILIAGAAGITLTAAGWQPAGDFGQLIGPLVMAYLVAAVVDELLAIPVIALATRTRVRAQFRTNWDLRLAGFLLRFLVALCTLVILRADTRLLPAIPPLVLSLHLAYSARVRTRTEQQVWRRLAQITDALNVVDLDAVLATAVTKAADLFSADEVEVELHEPRRLVRGSSETVRYDGPTAAAPVSEGFVITAPLEGHRNAAELGTLRLRFLGPIRLSEREQYTLSTFASALYTAIRNATAYAELARVAREHAYDAAHDALTGLANRRHLLEGGDDRLRQKRTGGGIALLLIDLNHFKEINDTLGHRAGDRVLVEVAERIRTAAAPDDLVARLGGDEFAVLLTGLPSPAMATHRAEQLLAVLREPLALADLRLTIEASGGVAMAPNVGGMDELLRRADVAMYQAKRSGRRLVTYAQSRTPDPGIRSPDGELHRTIGDYEFALTFQPIVDLGTGEVIAVEALDHWRHRNRATIGSLRYLATEDTANLLSALVDAVLDQALIAAGHWRDSGFDLPVAVNVVPRCLLDARFPSSVAARLRTHRLPADRLALELTEALSISRLEIVDEVLGRLRDNGVRLVLDDFGTGSACLSLLSRIPVHQLKIDQVFVTAMESSREATTVIRSTVELGHSLDLMVIADGVESEPQRRILWELGCGAGQGRLFGRPMSADGLLAALRRGCGGRPGAVAPALHDPAAVVRLPAARRTAPDARATRSTDPVFRD
ncbi:MAG TPA: bifunctional diguanylate cyclase/phosphodiesterase [Micromonosporaceae bacterium]